MKQETTVRGCQVSHKIKLDDPSGLIQCKLTVPVALLLEILDAASSKLRDYSSEDQKATGIGVALLRQDISRNYINSDVITEFDPVPETGCRCDECRERRGSEKAGVKPK